MVNLLATSIQVSGLSEAELELRLGWSPGSMRRLLEGESEPDPEQVLDILSELTDTAGTSWPSPAQETDERTQVVTDLVERFHRLGYPNRDMAVPASVPIGGDELETRVSSILRDAFGEDAAVRETDED